MGTKGDTKEALLRLQKASTELSGRISTAQIPFDNFLAASSAYLSQLSHISSAKEIYSSLTRWFEDGYICQIDEFMLLNNGAIEHAYHHTEHREYLHSRPDCKHIYHSNVFSMCSADGIDYVYRRLMSQKLSSKQEATLEKIAMANEAMASQLTDRIRKCHAIMNELQSALEGLAGVTSVIVESTYKSEMIKYHLFQEKLIKRSSKPRTERTSFRYKAVHRSVVRDENAIKRVKVVDEIDESIASIKRAYGVDVEGIADSRAAVEQEHRFLNPADIYAAPSSKPHDEMSVMESVSDVYDGAMSKPVLSTAERRQTSLHSLQRYHHAADTSSITKSNFVSTEEIFNDIDDTNIPQCCFPPPSVTDLVVSIILPDARTIEHSIAVYSMESVGWKMSVDALLSIISEFLWSSGESVVPQYVETAIEGDIIDCRAGIAVRCVNIPTDRWKYQNAKSPSFCFLSLLIQDSAHLELDEMLSEEEIMTLLELRQPHSVTIKHATLTVAHLQFIFTFCKCISLESCVIVTSELLQVVNSLASTSTLLPLTEMAVINVIFKQRNEIDVHATMEHLFGLIVGAPDLRKLHLQLHNFDIVVPLLRAALLMRLDRQFQPLDKVVLAGLARRNSSLANLFSEFCTMHKSTMVAQVVV